MVEDAVLLTTGQTPTQSLTNILRVGAGSTGRVAVEYHVTEPTRIKASVYDRRGQRLNDLMDEERGIGVWTVEWDGTNKAGRRVSAGIYFLVMESNGHVEKYKIIVQG